MSENLNDVWRDLCDRLDAPIVIETVLEEIARTGDPATKTNLAYLPKLPAGVANLLVEDKNMLVRVMFANNPSTPAKTLEWLAARAGEKEPRIRRTACEHVTRPAFLAMLACSENTDMRKGIAANGRTPPETLARLAEDEDTCVRRAVAGNPNTAPETLARLAEHEDWFTRVQAACNPNTPVRALVMLAETGQTESSLHACMNPHMPTNTLTRLAQTDNIPVRNRACIALWTRQHSPQPDPNDPWALPPKDAAA